MFFVLLTFCAVSSSTSTAWKINSKWVSGWEKKNVPGIMLPWNLDVKVPCVGTKWVWNLCLMFENPLLGSCCAYGYLRGQPLVWQFCETDLSCWVFQSGALVETSLRIWKRPWAEEQRFFGAPFFGLSSVARLLAALIDRAASCQRSKNWSNWLHLILNRKPNNIFNNCF